MDLSVIIDRGSTQTLSASQSDVTSAVDVDLYFPQGEWMLDGVSIIIANVGSPSVTIQNVHGTIWHLTTGNVLVTALSSLYSSQYSNDDYISTWSGSDIRFSEGDFLNYRNMDLESGSTMDLSVYVNATRLR